MSEIFGSPFVPPELLNVPQLIFLGLVYAFALMQAADMISEGSELLLLVPAIADVVGSVILPVLGAVPDGTMVLVSGLGPGASTEIYVGVGTLTGSTVMLLSIAWWVSVLGGRVDQVDGTLQYRRPTGVSADKFEKFTGNTYWDGAVACKPAIKENCVYMLGTLAPLVLCQVIVLFTQAAQHQGTITAEQAEKYQSYTVLFGFACCMLGFCWYLRGQYLGAGDNDAIEALQVDAIATAIKSNQLTLDGALGEVAKLDKRFRKGNSLKEPLLTGEELAIRQEELLYQRLRALLKPYFKKYDINNDNKLDFDEFRVICSEVSSSASKEAQHAIFMRMDTDKNGYLCFEEFIECMLTLTRKAQQYALVTNQAGVAYASAGYSSTSVSEEEEAEDVERGSEDDDDVPSESGDEDIPEELADLTPEQQQTRIKMKAAWMCSVGTFFVVAFSDPMVDVLNELATRTSCPPFFVSFVLSPLVSNASELVAAYNYAKKKTVKSATISLSTLVGAACMNNTFCLGCLLFVLYISQLKWSFTCEIGTMVIAEVVIAYIVWTRSVHTMAMANAILMIFPLTMILTWVGNNVLGWS
ncbi:unnamed protein product [Amoebophrya sp. A25]|nr:unnamed protein product [Amoebophrya sp. A25]|eukprot:GSA25T00003738001.1